jgi:hypothetical protein
MEGDEANGAGNAGTRAQIWQRLRAAAGAGVVELAAAAGASERASEAGEAGEAGDAVDALSAQQQWGQEQEQVRGIRKETVVGRRQGIAAVQCSAPRIIVVT